jgi:pimeloyl-ACP methyl ester carboxylesterase
MMANRLRRGYVDTPEGQIHYISAGEGGIPLILLHQNPSSARMWEAVLPGFAARGRQAIAFDTPGYGMSDPPSEEPDIPYYARRFVEAAGLLGFDRFDVGGHHTGALIAASIAADYPEKVRKLVLVGYPLLRPEALEYLAHTKTQQFTLEGHELPGLYAGLVKLGGQWITPEVAIRCFIEKLQAGPNWNWAYHAVSKVDNTELAHRVTVPALSICGGGDTLGKGSAKAVSFMKNGRAVVIEDGGVNLPDDAPEEFVDKVDAFLNEPD